jgi:hypothetical protein
MKRVALVVFPALLLASALGGLLYFLWSRSGPSVVGVWKATDEYGHEHYFEFHKDGSFHWWDRDRSHDGAFTKRGPFRGTYRCPDRKTVAVTGDGFPPSYLADLTLLSDDELKHPDGQGLRINLVYRRVADEEPHLPSSGGTPGGPEAPVKDGSP